ncbi:hypothetical protein FE257_007932 [Aspergillus nanangensis]|uniref:Carrier domain-containing protein n=1 Tax=Aspergillus nanangensis TaxID=2582783 RepID=A0AAD4CXB9_ASPNN|nr:hypothetical protein FE257_007932 [Aspergillus nanangensis]
MTSKVSSHASQPLPVIIENIARSTPDRLWAKCPITQSEHHGGVDVAPVYRLITCREFANAINHFAYMLRESLGDAHDFETLAYLGPSDIRYSIVVVAAMKAGYKTFLPSPRNSRIAFQTLMAKLDCKFLITTDPEPACVPALARGYKMVKLVVPDPEVLLTCPGGRVFPYSKTFDIAKDDPLLVLHTSGTTGIPKPLVFTNGFLAKHIMALSLEAADDKSCSLASWYKIGHMYCMLPPYHMAGMVTTLFLGAYFHAVPVYPVPGAPPTGASFIKTLQYVSADSAFLPPSIICDLAENEPELEGLATDLDYLLFAGGSVPQLAGDKVSSSMPLYSMLGSSECGAIPLTRPRNDDTSTDWNFICVHPFAGVEFQPRIDNMYEMVVIKRPEYECYQPVFTLFPDLSEYHTNDLFTPHPTASNMWMHRARMDDIIVLLNGEKTNPVSFEHRVASHPDVESALIAGNQQAEVALLVEMKDRSIALTPHKQARIIDTLWPVIQEANTSCPAHAKVSRPRILLTDPSKPMFRAGKGTVQRQATWELYAAELDALYYDDSLNEAEQTDHDNEDPDAIEETIRRIIRDVTQWEEVDDDDDDFFSNGMDSLHALQIRRRLKSEFHIPSLSTDMIYTNPSVLLLTQAIVATVGPYSNTPADLEKQRLETMQTYLDKYCAQINEMASSTNMSKPQSSPSHQTVVLTGSTGAIGSYILDQLLQTPSVAHIYCLNRSSNSEPLQKARNTLRNLPTAFPASRVTFLNADLSQPDLGLSPDHHRVIQATATLIIHNAWPVDFNQKLRSFEPSLDTVINLIRLVTQSPHRPYLFYLSSIAATLNYHRTGYNHAFVPETVLSNFRCASPGGYGESKYLAERMLDHAARQLHIHAASSRVGQVAGSTQAASSWNRHEWLPSLVVSSQYLKALPTSLGGGEPSDSDSDGGSAMLDWMAIDEVARVLVQLAFVSAPARDNDGGLRVFHPVHPRPTKWNELLPAVQGALVEATGDGGIEMVSFGEWVARLEESEAALSNATQMTGAGSTAALLHANPGLKLVEFYLGLLYGNREWVRMDTVQTLASSEALCRIESLKPEWLHGWARSWLELPN